ncbi:MAG: UDP-2,4-diacetamido-2,4,6-trideoxy-beta-L-altropyranose hydrolase [Anaerolineales bacterium]|nr:UDP-2,4-diacetamido-2,4,6-trideoxy-beta-L-altropyranose hydrolase [Chloroflexota bacterium]MBL6980158.1 UDP-2,4-diacetamido-2,4,6-trideoxy-beta-L-altropyranose hydrolase [Anaerolineales bacterium]
MNNLLIRADGNSQIGIGHLMRCLALSQAWQEKGGEVHFAIGESSVSLESRLHEEGINSHVLTGASGGVSDETQIKELVERVEPIWVVVDGYQFGINYQEAIKQTDSKLLFIDDFGHADHYIADLVLNQNVYAESTLYVLKDRFTKLLLGSRYALLRREFWQWRKWERKISQNARKIIITLGGGDNENVAINVIRVIDSLEKDDLEIVAVIGRANNYWKSFQEAMVRHRSRFRLEHNVADMPSKIAWADIAISAGGSTCWELAFMGLPTFVITLAENQKSVGPGLEKVGAAISLGWHNDISFDQLPSRIEELLADVNQRSMMTKSGQILVDGFGAHRVIQHMHNWGIYLRDIEEQDSDLVREWANDPSTRAASFSVNPISFESHIEWFKKKIIDPKCKFFIARDQNTAPIGQVRFQIERKEAVISVSVDPNNRGKGYGQKIIWLGAQRIFDRTSVELIHAYIKKDNQASILAFCNSGFVRVGEDEFQGNVAHHYILKR